MALLWPSILVPAVAGFHLKPMLQMGPRTFDGRAQRGAPDAGYWVATFADIVINSTDRVLEFRGLIAALEGGLEDVLVGPCEAARAPRVDGASVLRHIPYSDGTRHTDGAGFRQSAIVVFLTEDTPLRATRLTAAIETSGPLRRGMYFSVGERLHIITSVPEISAGRASFSFLPPLRQPASAGARLDFARPRCLMRLASGDTGRLDLELNRFGRPTVELEESPNGLS